MSSLAWYEIPSNVTDAGADRSPEPPPDFTDLCMMAVDEMRDAYGWRARRDDVNVQRKLKREHLEQARDYIAAALAMLEAQA